MEALRHDAPHLPNINTAVSDLVLQWEQEGVTLKLDKELTSEVSQVTHLIPQFARQAERVGPRAC